jgi:hypothetical protein
MRAASTTSPTVVRDLQDTNYSIPRQARRAGTSPSLLSSVSMSSKCKQGVEGGRRAEYVGEPRQNSICTQYARKALGCVQRRVVKT